MVTPLVVRRATGMILTVEVDYSQSLRRMIRKARLRVADPRLSEEHFPATPILRTVTRRVSCVRPLGREDSGKIYREVRRDCRFSDLPTYLAAIRDNRGSLDPFFPLAAFGALWDTGTEILVPVFTEEAGGVHQDFRPLSSKWGEEWTLLVELK